MSRWWLVDRWWKEVRRRFVQKDTSNRVERRGEEKGTHRGMYGDLESCDSTIKLGEFCSWRGVVPTTLYAPLHPLSPYRSPLSFSPFHSYLRFDSPYLLYHLPLPPPAVPFSRSSPRLLYASKYPKEDSRYVARDTARVFPLTY